MRTAECITASPYYPVRFAGLAWRAASEEKKMTVSSARFGLLSVLPCCSTKRCPFINLYTGVEEYTNIYINETGIPNRRIRVIMME
jgi:hypothetical protein